MILYYAALFASINILSSQAYAKPSPKAEKAKCFKADSVSAWETQYCLTVTGADDEASEASASCVAQLRSNKSIPAKGCKRIVWLKQKACVDDPSSGNTRKACLTDRNYLKHEELNPSYRGS